MRKVTDFIDHTLLSPSATSADIKTLCEEAITYGFASVCVNPYRVALCATELADSDVLVCTVVGFPLGATTTETKVFETERAIQDGAKEIDMVINVGALKDEEYELVKKDIEAVVEVAKNKAIVKVIIETVLLTDEEKVKACLISQYAGADYVKTSTGFIGGGATIEDIYLMRQTVGVEMGVKASGGIRDVETAVAMIEAGATRLGASSGVSIANGISSESSY